MSSRDPGTNPSHDQLVDSKRPDLGIWAVVGAIILLIAVGICVSQENSSEEAPPKLHGKEVGVSAEDGERWLLLSLDWPRYDDAIGILESAPNLKDLKVHPTTADVTVPNATFDEIKALFPSPTPEEEARFEERISLTLEYVEHAKIIDAIEEQFDTIFEDALLDQQELQELCWSLPTRMMQVTATQEFIPKYIASFVDEDDLHFGTNAEQLDERAAKMKRLLDAAEEDCQ